MLTYGGDEVNAIVLDMGNSSTRIGYAGETCPKADIPSQVVVSGGEEKKAKFIGDNRLYSWQPNAQVVSPFVDGELANWDIFEELLSQAYEHHLNVLPAHHPLLIAEPAWHCPKTRETITEIAMEKFQIPAFYLAKSPVLAALATGRHTALVLDCGAAWSTATPVYEGYVLNKNKTLQRQQFAGSAISAEVLKQFEKLGIDVVPQYMVSKKFPVGAGEPAHYVKAARENTSDSFHKAQVARVVDEFKETTLQVAETGFQEDAVTALPTRGFEFPNGFNYGFSAERFAIPEILFRPSISLQAPVTKDASHATAAGDDMDVVTPDAKPQYDSLQTLVSKAIDSCDIDIRHLLAQNVLVTGGTSFIPGFLDRLQFELDQNKYNLRVKINAPAVWLERKFSAWIGGSILASLGTFHHMWISQSEYKEHGKAVVEKRCL